MFKQLKSVSMLLFLAGISTGTVNAVALPRVADVQNTQQADNCKGVVKDATGETVIGASVLVKGTTNGTITDFDGNFTLSNVKKGDIIVVSFVGYVTQEIKWDGKPLNVMMKDDTQTLEEVVVVGFGTQKKVNLTGSVTSVGAKELASRPVNNVSDALQGVVPGMNFSVGSGGGSLDSDKKMNIRGVGTIGKDSSVNPLVLIDGMDGDLNTINPQDIENISVLKDASAASIYGSRAAGGVILVTTKRGKEGKTTINYNNSLRFNSPLNMPEMANSLEFAEYFNIAGNSTMFSPEKLEQIRKCMEDPTLPTMYRNSSNKWEAWDDLALLPTGNTNWLKEHFGNSFSHEHTLSVNGGSEKMQYYFSANYLDQEGILKHGDDNKQRYAITGKINSNLTKWLKFGYTVRFNRTDFDAPSYMGDAFYNDVCRYWPIIPMIDPNGHYTESSKVLQLTEGGRQVKQDDDLSQQLTLRIEPIKDWIINAELNYRVSNRFHHTDWFTVNALDADENPYVIENANSSVKEYAYKHNYFNANIFTEYSHSFGDHNFKIMGGFQSEWLRERSVTAQQYGILGGTPSLDTTSNNATVSGGPQKWATAGFFGRLNYDYKGRYLVEANIRYDGSSRFLKENRWNVFPSFSLGWNVAQEAFFEDYTDLIGTLKLRGSWGKLGNQNTENWYPFYPVVDFRANNGNWLINGKKPNTAGEPALVSSTLTWEKSRSWNVGFDLGMLRNRLNVNFDYFQRETYDMVGPAPQLPAVLGTAVPKTNNTDMTSKGWELQISWRDQINDFRYGASLSLSDNQITIDSYPNTAKDLAQYYSGAKLGDIWGFVTKGIAQTPEEMQQHLANNNQDQLGSNWGAGDIMYQDLDGKPGITKGTNTLGDHGDRTIIGNSTPRYNFGLNLDAAWKGFDLKVFFQGTLKRDYMPSTNTDSDHLSPMFWGADGGKWQTVVYKPHLDYWTPENPNAYYARPDWTTNKNRYNQTRYVQDASYIRLKNVTLGYTLPTALTQKFYVQNMRVFVSGENLLTFTDFTDMCDPELIDAGGFYFGTSYPLSKTFSLGLSVTF